MTKVTTDKTIMLTFGPQPNQVGQRLESGPWLKVKVINERENDFNRIHLIAITERTPDEDEHNSRPESNEALEEAVPDNTTTVGNPEKYGAVADTPKIEACDEPHMDTQRMEDAARSTAAKHGALDLIEVELT